MLTVSYSVAGATSHVCLANDNHSHTATFAIPRPHVPRCLCWVCQGRSHDGYCPSASQGSHLAGAGWRAGVWANEAVGGRMGNSSPQRKFEGLVLTSRTSACIRLKPEKGLLSLPQIEWLSFYCRNGQNGLHPAYGCVHSPRWVHSPSAGYLLTMPTKPLGATIVCPMLHKYIVTHVHR